jgi:signal recognition particle GTPase
MSKTSGLDLDSILDQALDDFDEIEISENAKKLIAEEAKQSNKNSPVKAVKKMGNVEKVMSLSSQ